jgi:hypothetical protein
MTTTPDPDRQALYDQVWAEPMTTVAARYGVSSSFLARVCERLNVPRPARGYWAKLAVGKASAKPRLQDARPGDPLAWSRGGEPSRALRALPKPPVALSLELVRRAKSRSERHFLVAGAREHFEGVKETENGYLKPSKKRLVDLFVSPATLDRALKVGNALFLALEERGHRVTLASFDQHLRRPVLDERSMQGGQRHYGYGEWSPDRPTVVYIGTVAIGLTLFELSEEGEVRYLNGKYVPLRQVPISERIAAIRQNGWTLKRDLPSGKLALRASSPYALATWEQQWREATRGELRSMFSSILLELEAAAATVGKLVEDGEHRAEEQRREWQVQKEKWEREEAERRRARNLKESREQLAAIIEAWGAAKQCHHRFDLGQNQRLRNGHIGGERSRAAAPSGVAPTPAPRVLMT